MDTTEKIVFGSMIFLLIISFFCLYLCIKKYRKNNKNYKKLEVETEVLQLKLLLFQLQWQTICEFLPDQDEPNPFEKSKSPDGSWGVFFVLNFIKYFWI